MKRIVDVLKDESGATAIEYGLIVALIVLGIIASITQIGQNFVANPMSKVGSSMNTAR